MTRPLSAGLEASLGGHSEENPSDSATLDFLEEIVYHTLEAGHAQEAFDIYWNRMGGFQNLGWRLGAYERGERICQAFADVNNPESPLPPDGLSDYDQTILINDWGLYLQCLGRLDAATRCQERANELDYADENWEGASAGNVNLSDVLTLAGRLTPGQQAAREASALAKRVENAKFDWHSHACCGHVHSLLGETARALNDFREALRRQHDHEGKQDRPLWGQGGVWHTQLLARFGQYEEAERLTKANDEICREIIGESYHLRSVVNLLLADLALGRADLVAARELQEQAHDWATDRDAKVELCWSGLVHGRVAFDEAREKGGSDAQEQDRFLEEAHENIEEGLRIARDCGFGIYHIDLLLLRAQVALYEGEAEDAERDILVALDEGIHPKKETGRPTLLAATDPECGYAWGIGDGQHLLAEAYLLQAAQTLGNTGFAPANSKSLPIDVKKLVSDACEQLKKSAEIRKRIQDPKLKDTKHVMTQLKGGALTSYRLKPLEKAEKPTTEVKKNMVKKHVFISYCHDNSNEVSKLRDDLIAGGETVWWDDDIEGGEDWKMAIRRAMKDCYAVVLCLSKEAEARTESGIFPEALDAIAAYREYAPGSIFLIPVRLSECEIPMIEIDATRTLDRLQRIDLFPQSKRGRGLQKLLKALQKTPHHP